MTSTRVSLVRHGQSEGNVAHVWTSRRDGYPLTLLGHEQAQAVGTVLTGRGVTALYASSILRAVETAGEIGQVLGLPVQHLDGVEELHVGVHEGAGNTEVEPIAIEVFGRWWRDGDLSEGFEGGETGREIADRMAAALHRVATANAGGTVVVVSHGGAMAVGLTDLCGNLSAAFVSEHLLANCDVVDLVRDDHGWRCESWAGLPPT